MKWLGWVVANILVVLLIWQKLEWRKEEKLLREQLFAVEQRTALLEQNIAELHLQIDQLEESDVVNSVKNMNDSLSDNFSSLMEKLKKSAKQLKDSIKRDDEQESQSEVPQDNDEML